MRFTIIDFSWKISQSQLPGDLICTLCQSIITLPSPILSLPKIGHLPRQPPHDITHECTGHTIEKTMGAHLVFQTC